MSHYKQPMTVSLSPTLSRYEQLDPGQLHGGLSKVRYKYEYLEQLEQINTAQNNHIKFRGQAIQNNGQDLHA